MLNRDKKQLLALAFPCLRRPGEKRPFFSDDIPTRQEFEALRKGLETGSVDDELLKKFFPRAYGGVRSLCIIPFYHEHNNPHQLAHRLEYPGLDEKELLHLV